MVNPILQGGTQDEEWIPFYSEEPALRSRWDSSDDLY
jgi:hypothetical protein